MKIAELLTPLRSVTESEQSDYMQIHELKNQLHQARCKANTFQSRWLKLEELTENKLCLECEGEGVYEVGNGPDEWHDVNCSHCNGKGLI